MVYRGGSEAQWGETLTTNLILSVERRSGVEATIEGFFVPKQGLVGQKR
jgi:hypothetical protein